MVLQDLRRLEAVCSDFYAFCSLAWRAGENGSKHFQPKHVDEVSRQIIPPNFCRMSVVPITSTGDSNCSFNSVVWRFVKQKPWPLNCDYELALNLPRPGHSTEITVLANVRIPHCGKDGPCVMSVETLCDLTCFSSSSAKVGDNGFERAFDHEIMRTCRNYSYSSKSWP